MTNEELDAIKETLAADASDEQKRDVAQSLRELLPSDNDNRTCVGFRTTLADKSSLHRIAATQRTILLRCYNAQVKWIYGQLA